MNEQVCKEMLKQKEVVLMKKKSEEVKKEEVKVVVKKKQKEVEVKKGNVKVTKDGKVSVPKDATREDEKLAQDLWLKRQAELDAKNEEEVKKHNKAVTVGEGQDSTAEVLEEEDEDEVVEVPKKKKSGLKIVPPVIEPVKKKSKPKAKEVTTMIKKRPEPEPVGTYFFRYGEVLDDFSSVQQLKRYMIETKRRVIEVREGTDGFRIFPMKLMSVGGPSYFTEHRTTEFVDKDGKKERLADVRTVKQLKALMFKYKCMKLELRGGEWVLLPNHIVNARTGKPERSGIKMDSNGILRVYYGSYKASKKEMEEAEVALKKSKKKVAPPVVKKINNKRR